MDEEEDISITNLLTEYITYIIIIIVIILIVPFFILYPGIYYGRWRTNGPVFYMNTKDGTKIEGMLLTPPEPEKTTNTILYFHGNGGNMGNTTHILSQLCENTNSYIVTIDYRGYGMSYGFPSESGLINDAESIYERILNDNKFEGTNKIVYGHSLGGAVALGLCEKIDKIDGLILENTFTCIKDITTTNYKRITDYIPDFILDIILYPNSWNSRSRIENIDNNIPILFISSQKDRIVPPDHMKELYDICKTNNKKFYKIDEGDHNNVFTVDEDNYINNINKFLDQL